MVKHLYNNFDYIAFRLVSNYTLSITFCKKKKVFWTKESKKNEKIKLYNLNKNAKPL